MKLAQLNEWRGTIGRRDYLLWAALLCALKYNIDRLVMGVAFDEPWEIVRYFRWNFPSPDLFGGDDSVVRSGAMLAIAIPFLWAGVVLTMQRLRSARMPLWLTVLFVVPVLKWVLFLLAALIPAREHSTTNVVGALCGSWSTVWPKSRIGSVIASIGITSALAIGFVVFSTEWLANYGWGLFVSYPFLVGFLAACFHVHGSAGTLRESVVSALLAVVVVAVGLLLLAIEGVICIIMAAPLALPLAVIGGIVGHHVRSSLGAKGRGELACVFTLAFPIVGGVERVDEREVPLIGVTTAIEIDAPPSVVWRHVVSFSTLPPPTEWMFQLGIAYPCEARIEGTGVGAVRHCVFSTGPFVEPIEIWDEPRLLRFAVTSNPAPMQEWTPYEVIHPPHLDGFLVSERGQFLLTELPDGRTRVEGTTWYRHGLWPAAYWQIWSDHIIHAIHARVLRHIARLCEEKPR